MTLINFTLDQLCSSTQPTNDPLHQIFTISPTRFEILTSKLLNQTERKAVSVPSSASLRSLKIYKQKTWVFTRRRQDLRLFSSQSLSIHEFSFYQQKNLQRHRFPPHNSESRFITNRNILFYCRGKGYKFSRFCLNRLFAWYRRSEERANLMDDRRITKQDKTILLRNTLQ